MCAVGASGIIVGLDPDAPRMRGFGRWMIIGRLPSGAIQKIRPRPVKPVRLSVYEMEPCAILLIWSISIANLA